MARGQTKKPTVTKANAEKSIPATQVQWASIAMKHAETYSKLLTAVDGKDIHLTKHDDEMYKQFKQDFPEVDVRNVKDHCAPSEKWDKWIAKWADKVEDPKFGTLVRTTAAGDYDESNTTFVMRIQFYAFEIARNKEGLNSVHHDRSQSQSPSRGASSTRSNSKSPERKPELTEKTVLEKARTPSPERKGKATRTSGRQ